MEIFQISTPAFQPDGVIKIEQAFDGWGNTGKNLSPELHWSGAPAGTQSFALTVHDPDAPTQSGFWHWLLFDIPANVTSLAAGAGDPSRGLAPKGSIQGRNDFGAFGYGGPCPPVGHGPHHYTFTLYALAVPKLGLDASASAAAISFTVIANAIGKATTSGYFSR